MSIKVAISNDIFQCLVHLPPSVQPKVSKFITQFQADPRGSGINYEKIRDARDDKVRSVRIDQAYRGIVLKPEHGDIYMLLWIDKHDDAYEWARRHKVNVNPETGTLQVFVAESADELSGVVSEKAGTIPKIPGAFDELKDKQLLRIGVPEEQIQLVRHVQNEFELDKIENRLPQEAYEGLFMYMAGSRYDEIINERDLAAQEVIDTNDYNAALQRLSSRGHFVVVEDELELQKMLNAPLEQWRVFLHPMQRKLAEGKKNGAVRVLGGAGTGKTVVAMHRAKWLAEHLPGEKKILFTTFTRNLALDIKENLSTICSSKSMERIEVINLDSWVSQFLRKRNYDYRVIYDNDNEFWKRALDLAPDELGLPDAFYREEWMKVIQPQSIENVDQYKRASRLGRGTRLNRADRVKIWVVFSEYRNLLTANRKKEVDDAYRDAASLIAQEASMLAYAAVVVDESQDMGTQAFRLIRSIVPEGENDIFVVGDGHQRIYGRNKVVLSRCGINIRGRARKLRVNYRTTDEIRRWAVNLLEGFSVDDLDGGNDDNKAYKSLTHGEAPILESFDDAGQQAEFVGKLIQQRQQDDRQLSEICIVARTKRELKKVTRELGSSDINYFHLTRDASDQQKPDFVRLGTMHRVKGLEFDEVVLVSLNKGIVPLGKALHGKGDVVEKRQADLEERALLYVAITRAKRHAVLLSYGEPSEYICT
ncbi:MAG: ATP-dependent helicase [gamma proteobacterium endosymbiont of Lamellibrachia anaximandri]|nr:ATP-dependent helicase [gamma proteobacterium endosymbiont of Lamellibrachia anaximandri]